MSNTLNSITDEIGEYFILVAIVYLAIHAFILWMWPDIAFFNLTYNLGIFVISAVVILCVLKLIYHHFGAYAHIASIIVVIVLLSFLFFTPSGVQYSKCLKTEEGTLSKCAELMHFGKIEKDVEAKSSE